MDDEFTIEGAETTSVSEITNVGDIPLIDTKKVQAAAAEEEKKAQLIIDAAKHKLCQRCGHDPSLSVISVTSEDKAAFLKSVLGEVPYTKSITTLHGNVTALLEASPTWMSNLVRDQLAIDLKKRIISNENDYRASLFKYYLISNLKELKIGTRVAYTRDPAILNEENITFRTDNGDTVLLEYGRKFEMWSDIQLTAVTEAVATFQGAIELMTRQASSVDFWKSVTVD